MSSIQAKHCFFAHVLPLTSQLPALTSRSHGFLGRLREGGDTICGHKNENPEYPNGGGRGGVCGEGRGGALNRPMSCNGSISGGVIAAASLTPD